MKWKILKYLAISIISLGIASVIGVGVIVNKYYKELPNVSELVENYTPPIPTTIYDRNGKVIDVISKETREIVDIKDVPKCITNAFIAIEDRHFWDHYGVDPFRILGSAIVNLKSGRAAQGGSTISQQLARNAFLTQEKKLSRKIKEVIITFEIERKYTKEEIMEKYLNEIYFGSGAYGVKTAALNFFRKDISDINLAEAAMLAGIPNRPNKYNPRIHLSNSLERQQLVLSQMLKFGLITDAEYTEALNHKFIEEADAKPEDFKDKNVTIIYDVVKKKIEYKAPDFTDLVKDYLFRTFDENEIYNNGLKVYTTLDLDFQKTAKECFENYSRLKYDKKLQGAMVTLDAKTGAVVSIIGGKDFKTGNFNRAVHAKRQLGSSFKPFVYFTLLEKGYEENLVVEDSRVVYGNWAPRNYGEKYYNGMTLMQGFDMSQNIISVKSLNKAGIDALLETMKKLDSGIRIPENLTAALGTTEGSAFQVAGAYAIFANGGYVVKPTIVTKVIDKFNNVRLDATPELNQKFKSEDIAVMLNMLKNSVKRGTSNGAKVVVDGKPIEQGGKTGTTNNSRTVWFSGFTPDYVTTIYIGYDNNKPLYKATGGGVVAPLWKDYYTKLIKKGYYKPTKFEFLENHIKNGDVFYQTLDSLTGLISSGQMEKEFLLRRGRVVVETDGKYANGISGLLGYAIPQPAPPVQQQATQQQTQKQPEKKKGLLQRIFGF